MDWVWVKAKPTRRWIKIMRNWAVGISLPSFCMFAMKRKLGLGSINLSDFVLVRLFD